MYSAEGHSVGNGRRGATQGSKQISTSRRDIAPLNPLRLIQLQKPPPLLSPRQVRGVSKHPNRPVSEEERAKREGRNGRNRTEKWIPWVPRRPVSFCLVETKPVLRPRERIRRQAAHSPNNGTLLFPIYLPPLSFTTLKPNPTSIPEGVLGGGVEFARWRNFSFYHSILPFSIIAIVAARSGKKHRP